MNLRWTSLISVRRIVLVWLAVSLPFGAQAQERATKPKPETALSHSEKPGAKPAQPPVTPAQIELLETHVRYEIDGSSRKEVHALVKINDELGVRQFARLRFGYNRAFQQVEIPMVHIAHKDGGTADILPSAIADGPVDAVEGFAAFDGVRAKSVRILGLAPGDTLEYRVITLTKNAPLAPEFSLQHQFARGGVVTREIFDVDLPVESKARFRASPGLPEPEIKTSGEGTAARKLLRWIVDLKAGSRSSETSLFVAVSSYASWTELAGQLAEKLAPGPKDDPAIVQKFAELTRGKASLQDRLQALYEFVSAKIATVDVPLDETEFLTRPPQDVLTSGYGSAEEKVRLLAALALQAGIASQPVLVGRPEAAADELPAPDDFSGIFLRAEAKGKEYWLNPGPEVLPFDMVPAEFRGKPGLLLASRAARGREPLWPRLPKELPFAAKQDVSVDASLAASGELKAKVKYTLRGDNELLLRMAFHQSAKEKWKELAQLLSLSDGFRGQVTSVSASDPLATGAAFTVEYEITQPKFVDWTRKSIRMPALLPQLGLPDPPSKAPAGPAETAIDLGTPLDVRTSMTLRLPHGTKVTKPTGTSVERDYATYASEYGSSPAKAAADGPVLTAARRLNFLLREVSAGRDADYNAFVHAVQSDETQDFLLEREAQAPEPSKSRKNREAAKSAKGSH